MKVFRAVIGALTWCTMSTAIGTPVKFGQVNKQVFWAQEPFPVWLADITGMHKWPGLDAPYVKGMNFNFTGIPDSLRYDQSICEAVPYSVCSFDCKHCVGPVDIRHCSDLIQTFDDGPTPDTPTLLHYLRHVQQKVTFFVLGIQVVVYPSVFRAMHSEGHLLATHTYSHKHLPSLTNEEVVAQLLWSIWAMNATAGVVPKYFRPPFGGVDNRVRAIAGRLGLTVAVWDLDTNDWRLNDKSRSKEDIYSQIKAWRTSNINGIMLEHDNTMYTVDAGIAISDIIGKSNMTVADCNELHAAWYQ
ncbi:CDA2-like protein [Lipomyces arxii]|uniref:CDA2-like protein n=1 Tax=Lipomyces arxii TaxID=56418 RepID=UPI0034CD6E56